MIGLLLPLGLVGLIYYLAIGRPPSRGAVGSAIDAARTGRRGTVLTALACAECAYFLELPTIGSQVVFLLAATVGFVFVPSITTSAVGGLGAVASLAPLIDGNECVAADAALLGVVLVVGLLLAAFAVATFHIVASVISAERHFGLWVLGVFAGIELLTFVLHPAGYSLLGAELGSGWLLIGVALLAVLVACLALAPGFTASVVGPALALTTLTLDVSGDACGASDGLVLSAILVMWAGVTVLRRLSPS